MGLCKHSLSSATGQFSIQLLENKKMQTDTPVFLRSRRGKDKRRVQSKQSEPKSVCSSGWRQQFGEQVTHSWSKHSSYCSSIPKHLRNEGGETFLLFNHHFCNFSYPAST